MITKEDIDSYIMKLPALPNSVKLSLDALNENDLTKAANYTKDDIAFSQYITNLVNRASFGFIQRVSDINQIYGILGTERAKSILTSYLVSLLAPTKWNIYNINNKHFNEFQSRMIEGWNKISEHNNFNEKYTNIIVLIPSAIIVSEMILNSHKEDLLILKNSTTITYNTLIKKLSGYSLFDISVLIAQKWELDESMFKIFSILQNESGDEDIEMSNVAKYIHLLLFYELSKPNLMLGGLNEFHKLNIDYVSDIYEEFIKLVDLES